MRDNLLTTPLGRLRIIAFAEGCSFLALGFTMILKYYYLMPLPNYIVGMLHGLLFILYVMLIIQVAWLKHWSFSKVFWAFIASLIPFGTFYADRKLFRV